MNTKIRNILGNKYTKIEKLYDEYEKKIITLETFQNRTKVLIGKKKVNQIFPILNIPIPQKKSKEYNKTKNIKKHDLSKDSKQSNGEYYSNDDDFSRPRKRQRKGDKESKRDNVKNINDKKIRPRNEEVRVSKALSWLLRHNAIKEGVEVDDEGYSFLDQVLNHRRIKKLKINLEIIQKIVENNDKKRFALKKDEKGKWKIRANQGHSFVVKNLELTPINKLDVCVHGTYFYNWERIVKSGLSRMNRQHIHMAEGMPGENGVISGMRYNCEVYIYIDVEKATKDGIKFFKSANGVVLSPGNENGTILPKYFKEVKDFEGNNMYLQKIEVKK